MKPCDNGSSRRKAGDYEGRYYITKTQAFTHSEERSDGNIKKKKNRCFTCSPPMALTGLHRTALVFSPFLSNPYLYQASSSCHVCFCCATNKQLAGDARGEYAGVQHAHAVLLRRSDPVARHAVLADAGRSDHAGVSADALSAAVDGARGARAARDAGREYFTFFFFKYFFFSLILLFVHTLVFSL